MRIGQFVRLAAFFAAVAGEICPDCSNDVRLSTNVTILEAPYKNVAAAGPPPPPPRTPPPGLPDRPPPNPQNEPATDEVWDRCRRKGCTLSWAMSHDDSEVGPQYNPGRTTAASPYQNRNQLGRWFWQYFQFDPSDEADSFFNFYLTWGIGEALASLGLNPNADRFEGGENHVVSYQHNLPGFDEDIDDQTYYVDGKQYRATGADFTFSLNINEGVIIAMSRTSPKEIGKGKDPPITGDGLPRLNQFSDVAWLEWQHLMNQNNGDVRNMRYFVSVLVVNRETQAVVARALRTRGKNLDDFPGQTFERGTDEMNAIMGTPNMQGFAYMLVQHKAQLGNMYIKKIQVFKCVTMREPPCIIAHVSKPDVWVDPGGGEFVRRDAGHNVARMHKIFAKL